MLKFYVCYQVFQCTIKPQAMTPTFLLLQILLLSATGLAIRPAHLRRQFETCDVSCGDGWCCLTFETCIKDPTNVIDGGWRCVVEGVSNTDGLISLLVTLLPPSICA